MEWFVVTVSPLETGSPTGFNCAAIAWPGFGLGREDDCGFLTPAQGQRIKIYTSWDLTRWSFVGDALEPDAQLWNTSIFFRPAVLRHPRTGKYVLWVNRIPPGYSTWDGYTRGGYLTAEADRPSGPFRLVPAAPEMAYGGGGDFALLQDGDRAWIAYGSWDNGYKTEAPLPPELNAGHRIAIQPLDETWTGVSAHVPAATVSPPNKEAPALFAHEGLYYLIYGDLCCFCAQGSTAEVHVALDPMGEWTAAGNLNPYGPAHVPGQINSIVRVPLRDGGEQLVWTADLWNSAVSGRKGRDGQFWAPLSFETRELSVGGARRDVSVPRAVEWVDQFTLDLALPAATAAKTSEQAEPLAAHVWAATDGVMPTAAGMVLLVPASLAVIAPVLLTLCVGGCWWVRRRRRGLPEGHALSAPLLKLF